MQTVLVTGGCGFIGSHTSYLLLKKGYKVIILDSNINSSEKVIGKIKLLLANDKIYNPKLEFVKGDLRDEELLENIFKMAVLNCQPICFVMHFAGLKSVSESISNPIKYWDTNVVSSIKLFKYMDLYKCRNIVFSSSATIYKINQSSLIKEDDPIGPSNPYGQTKFLIESILDDIFANSRLWKIANLRYFNPIGAHESGLIGENPIGIPNNIFPTLNRVAIGEIPKIKIYGNDWDTADGTGVRDYIHVMDLAEAHINAMQFLNKNKYQTLNLNLGTGIGTSVLDLIKIFNKINKVNIPYEYTERRNGDKGVVIADNSLAKEILNWEPKRNVYDMCKDGWKWQINNINGLDYKKFD